jgi:hypothetical protein
MIQTLPLSWGARVSPLFRARLFALCDHLAWSEDHASWLMAAMAFETGRTFSPSVRNAKSSATGLIQFMEKTAAGLGTTTRALAALTAEHQLSYVQSYFAPYAPRIKTLDDLYMAILWPAAIGRGRETALWRAGSREYAVNKGLDSTKDGTVTVGEAAAKVRRLHAEGLLPANVWAAPRPGTAATQRLPGGFL